MINTRPGMCIDILKGRILTTQVFENFYQNNMFKDISKIAGMEGMSVA